MPPNVGEIEARTQSMNFFGSVVVDLDVDGIDVGEALEEDALAFHDGLAAIGAEIAEAEDGGAVGDDGHHVALRRVLRRPARRGPSRSRGTGHATPGE
jgi:hypothetical protein